MNTKTEPQTEPEPQNLPDEIPKPIEPVRYHFWDADAPWWQWIFGSGDYYR